MESTRTLKLRIKDKHAAVLSAMAREVNMVWNFCNETSYRAIRERREWLSGFDLQKLTDGYSKCDGVLIGSATTQQVCEEYAKSRKQFRRARLNWRVSNPKSATEFYQHHGFMAPPDSPLTLFLPLATVRPRG